MMSTPFSSACDGRAAAREPPGRARPPAFGRGKRRISMVQGSHAASWPV